MSSPALSHTALILMLGAAAALPTGRIVAAESATPTPSPVATPTPPPLPETAATPAPPLPDDEAMESEEAQGAALTEWKREDDEARARSFKTGQVMTVSGVALIIGAGALAMQASDFRAKKEDFDTSCVDPADLACDDAIQAGKDANWRYAGAGALGVVGGILAVTGVTRMELGHGATAQLDAGAGAAMLTVARRF